MLEEKWGNELLCLAAKAGCMPIVQRLLGGSEHNTGLRAELLQGSPSKEIMHQSIGEAVIGNPVDVVEYHLSKEGIRTHLEHRNSRGENVLHLASKLCNPAMLRLGASFPGRYSGTRRRGRHSPDADH